MGKQALEKSICCFLNRIMIPGSKKDVSYFSGQEAQGKIVGGAYGDGTAMMVEQPSSLDHPAQTG